MRRYGSYIVYIESWQMTIKATCDLLPLWNETLVGHFEKAGICGHGCSLYGGLVLNCLPMWTTKWFDIKCNLDCLRFQP